MSITLLSDNSNFGPNSIKTDLVAFFTCNPDSDFAKTQQQNLQQISDLEQYNISVFFVLNQNSDQVLKNFIVDENNEIAKLSPKLASKKNPGQNLILCKIENDQFVYLDTKENPENKHNWIQAMLEVSKNYTQTDPDSNGYYKWGQMVPENGEYLCIDCGYIEEFVAGSVFPICEVCLAGEPGGPSETNQGFWEKI
jgi:rubrerythrin